MVSEWFGLRKMGWACTVAGLSATACGPDLYVTEEIEERVGQKWFSLGGGCLEVTERGSGSTGGGTAPGHPGPQIEEMLSAHDGVAEFTVTVEGEVIEHRVFDEEFLRSGKVEQVLIEVPDADVRRYSFWGPDCDTPVPSDIDAYEQAKQAADAGRGPGAGGAAGASAIGQAGAASDEAVAGGSGP